MEWVRGARKRDGRKPPPAPSSQPFEEVEERTAGCPGGVVGAVDGGLEVLRGGEAEGGPGAAAAPRPAAAPSALGLRPAAAAVAASCALEETVGRRRDAGAYAAATAPRTSSAVRWKPNMGMYGVRC